jgi:hypothetical protein
MSLRDKKSNLKNSKYIPDMRGGGSSGLPYIKPALPEDSPAGEYLAGITRTSADFPLRGGTYSTIASTEDTIRVSRFLNDFPKGAIFTSKQVGLQKSNPRIETGQLGSRLNTQTYNLNANLIAQVAEQGTGVHINRAGFNTNELRNDRNKYAYIVSHKSTKENRLVNLFNSKISGDLSSNINFNIDRLGISNDPNALFDYTGGPDSLYGDGNTYISRVVDTNESYQRYKQLGYSNPNVSALIDPTNDNLLLSKKWNKSIIEPLYPPITSTQNDVITFPNGEEITVEGVTTSLPNPESFSSFIDPSEDVKYQQSSPDFIRPKEGMLLNSFQGIAFNNTLSYKQLLESKNQSTGDEAPVLQDFRKKSGSPQSRIYNGKVGELVNIATRVGIGNPGARTNEQRTGTNIVVENGQDKVNMIPLYTDDTNPFETSKYGSAKHGGNGDARDLIKFAFEVIDNDNLNNTTKVHFRAFLTNFSDNHSAEWNGQNYMGRGEKFYTYQGANRQVSFNFKVAAQSKQEMMPLYQKLNYIVSSLYSDYNIGDGFMRGNIHQLTIGEYFYRTPGIITSMNITLEDDYPWEIKYSEPETQGRFETSDFPNPGVRRGSEAFSNSNSDADMMELPQILNVSVTFIPILNELPALSKLNSKRNDRRGILISNDVGVQENFINRIGFVLALPPLAELDPDITPINTDNN